MEKELQEMKATREASPRSQNQNNQSQSTLITPPAPLPTNLGDSFDFPNSSNSMELQDGEWIFTPENIDNIQIQPSDIAELFQR